MSFLSISIPTYNRSTKLELLLNNLFKEIKGCKNLTDISVFVSNNGSTDNTLNVLQEAEKKFKHEGLSFSYMDQGTNKGAGANVLSVYQIPDSEYIWWFSDDDILLENKLDSLVDTLRKNKPNMCNVGFIQPPFTHENPKYDKEEEGFFEDRTLIHEKISTKLTSMILKKVDNLNLNESVVIESYWPHVYMALDFILKNGGYYIYSENVAASDEDYLSIRFPPGVIVDLDEAINQVYKCNDINRVHTKKYIQPDRVKVNIHFLRLHLTGHANLPPETLKNVKKVLKLELFKNFDFLRFKYYRSYLAFCYHLLFNNKRWFSSK